VSQTWLQAIADPNFTLPTLKKCSQGTMQHLVELWTAEKRGLELV
jgi:hypothetical protein